MRKIKLLCIATVFAPMGLAAAADFDGSKPMLCAAMELQECVPGAGCERVTPDSINAAEFFHINVKKKSLVLSARNQTRPAQRIERTAETEDLLIVQGSDDGVEGVRDDGLAWGFAIDKVSGKMVLTASGNEVAFTIFGSCTIL